MHKMLKLSQGHTVLVEGVAAVGIEKKLGVEQQKTFATPLPQNVFVTPPPKCFDTLP